MNYKVCTECNKKKPIKFFYRDRTPINKISYFSKCKDCCVEAQRKRKKHDKDENVKEKICKLCKEQLSIDNFYKSTRHKDGFFTHCKTCHKTKEKKGYVVKRTKEYMINYNKKRYSDPRYIIRSSIRKSILSYDIYKNKNTSSKYLGCTIDFFKKWIEYQFDNDMSWENHGSYWHFDHVKPCASFDLSNNDNIFECYNWKNYRPLEKGENIEKSNEVIPEIIKKHKKLAKKYLNKNPNYGSATTLKIR